MLKDFAFLYETLNIKLVPIIPTTKRPALSNWVEHNLSAHELVSKYSNFDFGIVLGKHSNLICLDIDTLDKKLQKIINNYLENYPSPIQRIGNPEKLPARFYQYNGESKQLIKHNGSTVIELLADGQQVVIPPSKHSLKSNYLWINNSPLNFDLNFLPSLPKNVMPDLEKIVQDFYKDSPTEKNSSIGGRHNKLVEITSSMIGRNEPINKILDEVTTYDQANHSPPYFDDKSEAHGGLGKESAKKLIMSLITTIQKKGHTYWPEENEFKFSTEEKIETAKKDFKKLPKLEGLGKLIFDDLYNNSPIPRSQLCFMNTINLLSLMIGNKLKYKGTSCNLYQYAMAPSGYGKDFSFRRSKKILIESGLEHLIGTSAPTSDTLILTTLAEQKEQCIFINEAESLLKRMKYDSTNRGVREILTDLFDANGNKVTSKKIMSESKTGKKETEKIGDVYAPFLNLLLESTITGFKENSDDSIFETGFGSRFLFYFEDRFKRQKYVENYNPKINDDLIFKVRKFSRKFESNFDLSPSNFEFEINEAIITNDVKKYDEQIFNEFQNELERNKDKRFAALIGRKQLFFNRLVTIHHAMINHSTQYESIPLTKKSLEWAKNAVNSITHNMIEYLNDNVGGTFYGKQLNDIYAYIKRRTILGKETRKMNISSNFAKIDKSLRDKILIDLIEQEKVFRNESNCYVARKSLVDDWGR